MTFWLCEKKIPQTPQPETLVVLSISDRETQPINKHLVELFLP
jgi:hypothetical protein